MNLEALHGYVLGFLLIGGWLIVCLWSLALRLLRRVQTPTFWRAVSIVQVLLVVQLVLGLVLLVLGRRPAGGGFGTMLHLSYGILSPLVVLVVAHGWARAGRYDAHSIFAVAGLVNFGLAVRAWQVGLFGA
jgi:hypothetical protein